MLFFEEIGKAIDDAVFFLLENVRKLDEAAIYDMFFFKKKSTNILNVWKMVKTQR